MHKEGIPALGVFLEKGTGDVPDDGQFHVLVDGEVVFSGVSESRARQRYLEVRDELRDLSGFETGWEPPSREEMLKRMRLEHDIRAVSHDAAISKISKATRKGGKGR